MEAMFFWLYCFIAHGVYISNDDSDSKLERLAIAWMWPSLLGCIFYDEVNKRSKKC